MTAREYSMTAVAPTVCAVLGLPGPAKAKESAIGEIVETLRKARRVAVLAPDALGLFAWNLWKGQMPYLRSLHLRHSLVLRSVMPSITPVNFAAMVSGTDQEGHGIRTWHDDFTCETLFDVLRRNGRTSAGVGLTGYTGCELLGRLADFRGDAGKGSDEDIAEVTLDIAARHRPDFLIVQLGRVDDCFHKHGPSSPEVTPMLGETDRRLKRLSGELCEEGYGVMVLADHGQHDILPAPGQPLRGGHGTASLEDCQVPCTWVDASDGA